MTKRQNDAKKLASATGSEESPGGEARDVAHQALKKHTTVLCGMSMTAKCLHPMKCDDGSLMTWIWYEYPDGRTTDPHEGCASETETDDGPVSLTVERVIHAFRELPLPAAPLVIQPPKGRTLVNFDTVFYTTQGSFRRSVRLLGHRVEFRIRPNEFSFVFGDGHWLTTRDPGRPFTTKAALARDITHRYLTKGMFHPSLETTYGADFRVDGGRWRAVAGTVTIQGPELDLEAVTATPVLVD
ncbi:hypothetical protein [Nocardioides eburneus]